MKLKNTSTKLEHFLRSFSSKRRINILFLLDQKKDLSIREIANNLNTSEQNISLHTFKLLNAGLIAKMQKNTSVLHILTKRGEKVVNFIKEMDRRI